MRTINYSIVRLEKPGAYARKRACRAETEISQERGKETTFSFFPLLAQSYEFFPYWYNTTKKERTDVQIVVNVYPC